MLSLIENYQQYYFLWVFCRVTVALIYTKERTSFLLKLAMISVFTESSMALRY